MSLPPVVDVARLTAPFPREAIKVRQGGGGRMLEYVEGHAVIRRLNDASGNHWDMEVKSIDSRQLGSNTLMVARVALTLPGLGTREGLGVQLVSERGGEDLVKGCVTDALKKAATLFGVGLELYGPDYEADAVLAVDPAVEAMRTRLTASGTLSAEGDSLHAVKRQIQQLVRYAEWSDEDLGLTARELNLPRWQELTREQAGALRDEILRRLAEAERAREAGIAEARQAEVVPA